MLCFALSSIAMAMVLDVTLISGERVSLEADPKTSLASLKLSKPMGELSTFLAFLVGSS